MAEVGCEEYSYTPVIFEGELVMMIGTLSGEKSLGLVMDLCQRLRSGNRTLEELALFNEGRFGELAFGCSPVSEHVIDCDAPSFIPDGLKVKEHQKSGKLTWDAPKVTLYLSDNQKDGKIIEGNRLRKELADKPVLNANVLDYLLANPHLIPEEWKGKAIFFWGTIYRRLSGDLYVRSLYWGDGGWDWRSGWLDGGGWRGDDPAAVFAK